MKTIYLKLLRCLQSRCEHPDYAVKADILEGDWSYGKHQVQWCEICGAWRVLSLSFDGRERHNREWREPRPDWYTPKERRQLAQDLAETIRKESR